MASFFKSTGAKQPGRPPTLSFLGKTRKNPNHFYIAQRLLIRSGGVQRSATRGIVLSQIGDSICRSGKSGLLTAHTLCRGSVERCGTYCWTATTKCGQRLVDLMNLSTHKHKTRDCLGLVTAKETEALFH